MSPTTPILLPLVTAPYAVAQPSRPSLDDADKDPYRGNLNAATTILIVATVSGFLFLACLAIYFRRCSRDSSAVSPAVAPAFIGAVTATDCGAPRGLDPALIETFPILTYSAVTGLKIGKEALECAVCLSEFSDDETLRMLPRCCHVFHLDCIDTWLASHVTCPVCRADLSVVPTEVAPGIPGEELDGTGRAGDDVAIDLGRVRRVGRSHSMGHVTGGNRFTLRLPEHVRREIVEAGRLQRSASVAVFWSGGEGSARRGYRGERGLWAGLSDRWASGILTRVSTRRRGEAEGSVKKRKATERGGMFNCLGGGDDSSNDEASCKVDDDECSTVVLARV